MTRDEDVTDHGERVTHPDPTFSYYAHLSLRKGFKAKGSEFKGTAPVAPAPLNPESLNA